MDVISEMTLEKAVRGSIWGKLLYLAGMQLPLPFLHFPTAVDLGAAWEIWDQGGPGRRKGA